MSLLEGTSKMGSQRILEEQQARGEIIWDTGEALIDWLESHPQSEINVWDAAERVVEILIRDGNRVVTALVVGGSLVDIDLFPVDIQLWGQDKISAEMLQELWMLLAESAQGTSYWEGLLSVLAAEGEEERRDECDAGLEISSVDAKATPQIRTEIDAYSIDCQVIRAMWTLVSLGDAINMEMTNTAVGVLSLEAVRVEQFARSPTAASTPWYWGEASPSCSTDDTRRRCSQIRAIRDLNPSLFTQPTPGDASKVTFDWTNSGFLDTVSTRSAAQILMAGQSCPDTTLEALSWAEDGLRNDPAGGNAQIPVAVNLLSALRGTDRCDWQQVIFEYAEDVSEFKY